MSRICIKNIGKNCNEKQLTEIFSQKGEITDIKIVKNKQNNLSRNFAFVGYRTDVQATDAISYFNNTFIGLSRITVEYAKRFGEEKNTKNKKRKEENEKHSSKVKEMKSESIQNEKGRSSITEKENHSESQPPPVLSKKKQEFLELMKPSSSKTTMMEKSTSHLVKEQDKFKSNPMDISDDEDQDEQNENGSVTDSDNDSAIDLDELINKQTKQQEIKDQEKSEKKMYADIPSSDLDYLRSKMTSTVKKDDDESSDGWSSDAGSDEEIEGDGESEEERKRATSRTQRKESISESSYQSNQSTYSNRNHEKFDKATVVDAVKDVSEVNDDDIGDEDKNDEIRLFIKNLPYSCTEDELKSFYEKFGKVVEVHIPLNKQKKTATTEEEAAVEEKKNNTHLKGNKTKGIGFVTFLFPSDATKACEATHGTAFQGRILYVNKAEKQKEKDISLISYNSSFSQGIGEGNTKLSSFQLQREEEKRKKLLIQGKNHESLNSTYIRSDTVLSSVADRYGIEKSHLLNTAEMTGGDLAVRLAIAETSILHENKEFFNENNIDFEQLARKEGSSSSSFRKPTASAAALERSSMSLLVKNLPPETDFDELQSFFLKYGSLSSYLVPPSKTLVLVTFEEPSEARAAYKSLAYRRYKNSPLFLEWAPSAAFLKKQGPTKKEEKFDTKASGMQNKKEEKEKSDSSIAHVVPDSSSQQHSSSSSIEDENDNLEEYSTLFIKNLNFQTNEETLQSFLQSSLQLQGIRKVIIQRKQKGSVSLSQGYGFIEFRNNYYANEALKKITKSTLLLDNHRLEVKPSEKRISSPISSTLLHQFSKSKQLPTKLLVRNIAFQATKNEIMNLFKSFGSIKSVRIPKKMNGSHRGFAFIEFSTSQEALNTMNSLKSTHFYGRHLVIEWAKKEDEEEDEEQIEDVADNQIKKKTDSNGNDGNVSSISLLKEAKNVENLRKRAREDAVKIELIHKRKKKSSSGVGGDDIDVGEDGNMKELL
jgi:multiple RNA-binding domain-containing protein 1